MNNKLIFLFFFVVILNTHPVESFFTRSHEYWTIKGFEEISSPITLRCSDKLNIVLDGNHFSDAVVIHYFDKDVASYLFTHSKNDYNLCVESAGTDEEMQCHCVGRALHKIQDSYSHNEGGVTALYLRKYLSSNMIGHMTVEKSFENGLMPLVEKKYLDKLNYYDKIVLNSAFEEYGGSSKYFDSFYEATNINIKYDAQIFRSGYLGEGFYDFIYKDKVDLIRNMPYWFPPLVVGLIILSATIIFIALKFGMNKWKYAIAFEGLLFGILGILIIFSILTGTTWKITSTIIEIPSSFGYLSVSDEYVTYYNKQVQDATNAFLRNGKITVDDVSGRSYVDSNGVNVVGALTKAERGFQYTLLPVLIISLVLLNFLLYRKTFPHRALFRR